MSFIDTYKTIRQNICIIENIENISHPKLKDETNLLFICFTENHQNEYDFCDNLEYLKYCDNYKNIIKKVPLLELLSNLHHNIEDNNKYILQIEPIVIKNEDWNYSVNSNILKALLNTNEYTANKTHRMIICIAAMEFTIKNFNFIVNEDYSMIDKKFADTIYNKCIELCNESFIINEIPKLYEKFDITENPFILWKEQYEKYIMPTDIIKN